jgi:hypothetical protein
VSPEPNPLLLDFEDGVQVAVGEAVVEMDLMLLVVVVGVVTLVVVWLAVGRLVVVVVAPPVVLILFTSLSPSAARLSSNSSAEVASHFAPLAPGTASAPVKAMYSTSASSWPLFPLTELPKQRVAIEMLASPMTALGASSPFSSPQMP